MGLVQDFSGGYNCSKDAVYSSHTRRGRDHLDGDTAFETPGLVDTSFRLSAAADSVRRIDRVYMAHCRGRTRVGHRYDLRGVSCRRPGIPGIYDLPVHSARNATDRMEHPPE